MKVKFKKTGVSARIRELVPKHPEWTVKNFIKNTGLQVSSGTYSVVKREALANNSVGKMPDRSSKKGMAFAILDKTPDIEFNEFKKAMKVSVQKRDLFEMRYKWRKLNNISVYNKSGEKVISTASKKRGSFVSIMEIDKSIFPAKDIAIIARFMKAANENNKKGAMPMLAMHSDMVEDQMFFGYKQNI